MNEIKLFANDWKLLHKAKQNIFQLTFIIFQCHILMLDKLGEPVVKVWEGNKCFGIVSKSPFDLKFFVKLSIKIFFSPDHQFYYFVIAALSVFSTFAFKLWLWRLLPRVIVMAFDIENWLARDVNWCNFAFLS